MLKDDRQKGRLWCLGFQTALAQFETQPRDLQVWWLSIHPFAFQVVLSLLVYGQLAVRLEGHEES